MAYVLVMVGHATFDNSIEVNKKGGPHSREGQPGCRRNTRRRDSVKVPGGNPVIIHHRHPASRNTRELIKTRYGDKLPFSVLCIRFDVFGLKFLN